MRSLSAPRAGGANAAKRHQCGIGVGPGHSRCSLEGRHAQREPLHVDGAGEHAVLVRNGARVGGGHVPRSLVVWPHLLRDVSAEEAGTNELSCTTHLRDDVCHVVSHACARDHRGPGLSQRGGPVRFVEAEPQRACSDAGRRCSLGACPDPSHRPRHALGGGRVRHRAPVRGLPRALPLPRRALPHHRVRVLWRGALPRGQRGPAWCAGGDHIGPAGGIRWCDEPGNVDSRLQPPSAARSHRSPGQGGADVAGRAR
mmetsp:Transcript_14464/g.54703  ORF Transcript_14464/g.54703 Transcript_14464/m.54703 type:complete len:256 (+) Transcript_14464:3-770(+)